MESRYLFLEVQKVPFSFHSFVSSASRFGTSTMAAHFHFAIFLVLMHLFCTFVTGLSKPHTAFRRIQTPSVPTVLPGNWTSQGCYTDIDTSRTLDAASLLDSPTMSVEFCIGMCTSGGFSYAGVEFGQECYCDYAIQTPGAPAPLSDCNLPCTGNSSETCGSANHLNLFYNGAPNPIIIESVGGWVYHGCFTDNVNNRTLSVPIDIPSGATTESCTAACQAAGSFIYAGTEFSDQCYCGNNLSAGILAPDSDCRRACTDNPTEFCGGLDRLSVYQFDPSAVPPNPQQCVSFDASNFTLLAVYSDPPAGGPTTLPLQVIADNMPNIGSSILSACTSCSSFWPFYSLQNGAFAPQCTCNTAFTTTSVTLNNGDTPSFSSITPAPPSFDGYCTMATAASGPNSPPILAVNGHSDLWSLCQNNTANSRLDVVFSPIDNHPDYDISTCNPITIQVNT